MVENYRPISLLNNVSKLMECLITMLLNPLLVMLNMDLWTTNSNLLNMFAEVGATLYQGCPVPQNKLNYKQFYI